MLLYTTLCHRVKQRAIQTDSIWPEPQSFFFSSNYRKNVEDWTVVCIIESMSQDTFYIRIIQMLVAFSLLHQYDIRLLLGVKSGDYGGKQCPKWPVLPKWTGRVTAFSSDACSNSGILCTRQCPNRIFSRKLSLLHNLLYSVKSNTKSKIEILPRKQKYVQTSPYRCVIDLFLCAVPWRYIAQSVEIDHQPF